MKLRLSAPGHLIDVGQIDELQQISTAATTSSSAPGPRTTTSSPPTSSTRKRRCSRRPFLIGDVQVRNMGTIGGSLAHADPAADYPAAVLAANARIRVRGTRGEREIAGSFFFVELYMTSLAPDEIILDVRVPSQGAGTALRTPSSPTRHPGSRSAAAPPR